MNTNNSKPRCEFEGCEYTADHLWSDGAKLCGIHTDMLLVQIDMGDEADRAIDGGEWSAAWHDAHDPAVVGDIWPDGSVHLYEYGDAFEELQNDYMLETMLANYDAQSVAVLASLDETQTAPVVAVANAAAARMEHDLLSQTNVRDYATREAEAAEHNALCAGDSEDDASKAYYDAYESALDYAAQHPEQFEEAQDAINN